MWVCCGLGFGCLFPSWRGREPDLLVLEQWSTRGREPDQLIKQ
jgi:hypothetical protein